MYTHVMLIWLINVYGMLPLVWQKHWKIEALPGKTSIPSTFPFPPSLQCYFENPVYINACFPLFHTPFFLLQTSTDVSTDNKILTDPFPVEISWLVG